MSQLQSRAPGVVGAAFSDTRLAARLMGDRLFLVADATPTLGSEATGFDLSGVTIRRSGGRLIIPEGTSRARVAPWTTRCGTRSASPT